MKFNKSFDYTENSSTNFKDVLDQIKKRTEELSTSEASIRFLSNLSNPTNLTNPLIINSLSKKNQDTNKFHLPSLKSRRVIMKNCDDIVSQKHSIRSNSNILSRNNKSFLISDPFEFQNYKKIFKEAEKDLLDIQEKKRMTKILHKLRRNDNFINSNNLNNNRYDEPSNYDTIFDKLKHSQSYIAKKDKEIRVNYFNFIPKRKILEKCNNIRLLHYHKVNKNVHIKKYLSMKKAELKSTDNIIKKLKKSKDYLNNNIEEKYRAYLRFLNQTNEKENLKNDEIIKEKTHLINDIYKLKIKIEKIKNNKRALLDWIYLQIRMRKKMHTLPIYYKYIIEDNISYKNINKISKGQYCLNLKDYNEINNYKTQPLYENAKEMAKDLDEFQIKSLNQNDDEDNLFNEKKNMKNELKELIKKNKKEEEIFNEIYNQLIEKINNLKAINKDLEIQLFQVKTKKVISRVYKDKNLLKKISLFSNMNSNQETMNFILTNNKPTLFNLSICLYNICMLCPNQNQERKKLILDFTKSDEDIMFMIFRYATNIVDELNQEKKNYYLNKKSRERYIKIKSLIEKDARRERTKVKIEMKKNEEMDKSEKLKEKLNKKYFKRLHKIDFVNLKLQKKRMNERLNLDIKKQTKLEDFFYDIEEN